jgi:hypothetical protein
MPRAFPVVHFFQHLASRRIYYINKVFTYGGNRSWSFAIKDPNSAREIDFPVPAGSSDQTIISEAYKAAVTFSSVTINGKRSISEDHRDWIFAASLNSSTGIDQFGGMHSGIRCTAKASMRFG